MNLRGKICTVDQTVEGLTRKEKNRILTYLRNNVKYVLVLKTEENGKCLVTRIAEHEEHYSHKIHIGENSYWFCTGEFLEIDETRLIPTNVKLGYALRLISILYRENREIEKHRINKANKANKKSYKDRKKAEEKKLMNILYPSNKTHSGRKYPYGSGIARRFAPSLSIRFVSGGGVSPR